MRVPNCASILKDWLHHTFISCFFHILRARKQILSQESKSSIGLGTHISNMRVPFQITCNCYTDVYDAFNIGYGMGELEIEGRGREGRAMG